MVWIVVFMAVSLFVYVCNLRKLIHEHLRARDKFKIYNNGMNFILKKYISKPNYLRLKYYTEFRPKCKSLINKRLEGRRPRRPN